MSWEAVIGLEVHVQLASDSKIFSGASTRFGSEPNSQASLVDLGMHSPALAEGHPFESVEMFYWSATTSRYWRLPLSASCSPWSTAM